MLLDATALVNRAWAGKRWLALLLTATGAERRFAGRTYGQQMAPTISVVYADGSTGVLACTCAANAGPSTASSVGRTA